MVVVTICLLVLSGVSSAQGNSENAFERVKEVQERHTDRLLAMDDVEGTAIGYNPNNRLAVNVFTAGPGVAGIPKTLDGVPVHVVVTGKFYALPKGGKPGKKPPKVDPTGRFDRPVPIGISTGNAESNSAGTIGCRVSKNGQVYALSNNHVYALENTASKNSKVLQPGRYDGGTAPDDVIGTLDNKDDYVPIDFSGGSNKIDAAIALIDLDDSGEPLLGCATPSDGYGAPKSETVVAAINMPVKKYGRTTGLTTGKVYALNATVNVGYDSGIACFVNQIIITPGTFSAGGDSGSLVVASGRGRNKADDRKPVGLLFAGSSLATVANPIEEVLSALDVTIDGD